MRSSGPGVGAKISAVVAGLLVLLVTAVLLLLQQIAATSTAYSRLVADEVGDAQLAARLQVAVAEQGQAGQDVLLAVTAQTRADRRAVLRARVNRVDELAADLRDQVDDPVAQADLEAFGVSRAADRAAAVTARLDAVVQERVAVRQAAVARQRQLVVLLGGVGVVALLMLLVVFVVRVVRPIRAVTAAALEIGRERLPAAVRRIATADEGDPTPVLEPVTVASGDELADLAAALTALQDAALGLAVEQHRRERESVDLLINLGRRNQVLLARVQSGAADLVRAAPDADLAAAALRVDRAAARALRNAASVLVLAGASPVPARVRAVPMPDVVRAALAQIEDGGRIDVHRLEEAAVSGAVAPDLAHLLAELLENATTFSSPVSRVVVAGTMVRDGYHLRVVDQGIGMTRDELDAANAQLLRADAQVSSARLLGLNLVARLAARHDVEVVLEAAAGHGITASVLVPAGCLMPAELVSGWPGPTAPAVLDITLWEGAQTSEGEPRQRS